MAGSKGFMSPAVNSHVKEMLELVHAQAPKIDIITASCKASKAGKPPRALRGKDRYILVVVYNNIVSVICSSFLLTAQPVRLSLR